jgi:hypothetical protein
MRNLHFILFVFVNLGLFQGYRCVHNITDAHIEQNIGYDEFTTASANQLDGEQDDHVPSQKKKRKRIRITDQAFDLELQVIRVYSHSIKLDNSFLPEAIYTFSAIFFDHKRGPPLILS